MTAMPRHGLYAIADTSWVGAEHILEAVSGAIAGGAVIIQLRDKHAAVTDNPELLDALLQQCRSHAVPFILNDDAELAARIGADGVHTGREDGDPAAIRSMMGSEAIVGVSCHNDVPSAEAAVSAGADYVAFGRFFDSQTKPGAIAAELDTLRRARNTLDVPIVAIGGITPDNGTPLLEAGADLLAVIAGIFAQPDTRKAAAAYQTVIQAFLDRQSQSDNQDKQ